MESEDSQATGDLLVAAVRAEIGVNFADGIPTIDYCASRLGISRRTLQRRLLEAGVTFIGLLNQIQFETAVQLLAEEIHSVADIAARLGYANASNFAKAFQRLSGFTPSEFRRDQQKR